MRALVQGERISGCGVMGNVRKAHPIHALLDLDIPSHKFLVVGQMLLVVGYLGHCHSCRPVSAVSASVEAVEGACLVAEAGEGA